MSKKILPIIFKLLVTHICISQTLTKKDLMGSFTLKQIDYIYTDTTIALNPSQAGFLVLSPKRYAIAYNPGLNPRKPFENLSNPTDAEVMQGFKTFAFNSGSYSYKKGVFTANPDFAKVPGFEGGVQVYDVKQSDGLVAFTMYDETYPNGDKPAWYGKLKIKLSFEKE